MRSPHIAAMALLLSVTSLLFLLDGFGGATKKKRGLAGEYGMMAACGSAFSYSSCGGMEEETDKSELRAVRCCRDSYEDGWHNEFKCDVWAKTKLFELGVEGEFCFSSVTHDTAEALCASNGARLCTASELLRNCAARTGCGHDHQMVWTSSYPFPLHARTHAINFAQQVGLVVNDRTVYNIDDGEWITYDDIYFGPAGTTTKIRVRYGKGCCAGRVEIKLGDRDGETIGEFVPEDTGDWDNFTEVDVDIADVDGLHQLTFVGKDDFGIMNFEWFELLP